MQAFHDEREAEHRLAMSTAWHTAALQRLKRIPPLESMFGGQVTAAVQSVEQMKGIFAAMREKAQQR
ncbi:hypothetical protein ACFPIF_00105 [Brevundimonas faecalis]|uniref:hypothetical protein n=1 Tax=Brevundimonas faecalis TaxID=947378 RepID=UPI003620A68F